MAIPLLVTAFTITRPAPLPNPSSTLQPAFDSAAAIALARDLAAVYPDRSPGSPGAPGAARWVEDKLDELGIQSETDTFEANIPGRGDTTLRNVVAVVPGRSRDAILVVAHRDSTRGQPGLNDNASGTGALLELARGYAPSRTGVGGGVSPNHTIVFVSTDAGAYGHLGARRVAESSSYADRIVAVLVLDSIASGDAPRLELAGRGPRSPAPVVVATTAARLADQTGSDPAGPGVLAQLLDLGFPFSLYEQSAFLDRRLSAVTVTTEESRSASEPSEATIDSERVGQVGRAAESVIASLDAGLDVARGTATYLYVQGRVIQGWALAFLYITLLIPFLLALADLLARLRARRAPFAGAVRSYLRRLGFWLWAGFVFGLLGLLGAWPGGEPVVVNPAAEVAGHWPRLGIAVCVAVVLGSWVIARRRLVRHEPVGHDEEIAGLAVPLAAVAIIALVLIATNPYALLFVLPSAHAWLWLIDARRAAGWLRALLVVAGLAGPLLVLVSFAARFGLGLDAPWYLAVLVAIGYVPLLDVVLSLAWLAAAAQVIAVASGRYAPYPAREHRPARGAIGHAVAGFRGARKERLEK